MTTYPYRQGIDYGSRSGTRGLSFHMSEGGDGLVTFLAQREGEKRDQWIDRVNGVSCHAALLSDGTIWQMLGWDRACGNLNPYDRAGEYGYYGHHFLVDVLGDGWTNPNEWTISMEIAGYRAVGPTAAQVRAAIAWGQDMRSRFPTLCGATGHHDQSPKGCPGVTANMKAIFTGVGGHGLWSGTSGGVLQPAGDSMPGLTVAFADPVVGNLAIPYHTDSIIVSTGLHYAVPAVVSRQAIAGARLVGVGTESGFLVNLNPPTGPEAAELAFIRGSEPGLSFSPPVSAPEPVSDCTVEIAAATAAIQAELDAAKNTEAAHLERYYEAAKAAVPTPEAVP
jgi:hypothetical protein